MQTDNPTIDTFRDILEKHPNLFYSARTPKSLSNHWHLMKQYSLLPDQTVQVVNYYRDNNIEILIIWSRFRHYQKAITF